ncbi:Aim7 protein [Martiniozyma asiatica (nom. inval.)]|nr:Aim7 protein [Martiniozyma asiatica]
MSSITTFPSVTVQTIRKFRLTPLKTTAKTTPAQIYKIENSEVLLDEEIDLDIDTPFDELFDEIPDNSPRFILINYGYKKDDRFVSPLVGIYWRPRTARGEVLMMYAGTVEKFKGEVGANIWLEISEEEEWEEVKELIESK